MPAATPSRSRSYSLSIAIKPVRSSPCDQASAIKPVRSCLTSHVFMFICGQGLPMRRPA